MSSEYGTPVTRDVGAAILIQSDVPWTLSNQTLQEMERIEQQQIKAQIIDARYPLLMR